MKQPDSGAQKIPCVLLVEDEAEIRSLLADEIRAAGVFVVEHTNADEAWDFLQSGARVDLVFSDVNMPGTLDGLTLVRLIRAQMPEVKTILTSGNLGPRNISDIGIYLQKPFRMRVALNHVLSGLGRDTL
ncbi:MAG: response regulator [Acidocella sp.]|nr:response regulator [Acidocella sp.]